MDIKEKWKSVGKGALNGLMDSVISVGKGAVHAMMPDDYEYYLCSFELYDSNLERKGFLSFVVMPDQITENYSPIQSVTKTHSGIVTTFNSSFAPVNITISGTFGRKFRLVSNYKDPSDRKNGLMRLNLNLGEAFGSVGIKSGYGLTKILKNILECANKTDDLGKPYLLIFNNYAFNTSYIVNPSNFQFHQGYDNNMIWYYSINMTAVGNKPHKAFNHVGTLLGSVAANSISNGLTNVITNMIGF